MTKAQELLDTIEDMDLDAARAAVFEACTLTHEGELGYGPATTYDFADGSTITYDGRGFTAA